ncbi:MAG: hypothetical protein KDC04_00380 [Saprospiraceae bacterium]|nr:hypothetical protein [Saprospiraceae bacterium]MCB9309820.1 hypothetical protein [Lewinellaceae bacterium]
MRRILFLLVLLYATQSYSQQISVSADVRMRLEQRDGFGTLSNDTIQPATYIAQRTRMNILYKSNHLNLKFAPQNYRVWGDVSTVSTSDVGNALHEAYAEVIFNKKFSLKAGRQEIALDDHRIFGSLDWAMQGRSHDAALLQIAADSLNKIQIGLAINSNKESLFRDPYRISQYKAFQYIWYHGDLTPNFGLSFLFLNNGLAIKNGNLEEIEYSQTAGPRFLYKNKRLTLDGYAYWQFGKLQSKKLKAANYALNLLATLNKQFKVGGGVEYLSGKASNDTDVEFKSFTPLYGTNHKFNGFMDYFYVGNHANNVGLIDYNFRIIADINKLNLMLKPHIFNTAADLVKNGVTQNSYLGTEIDFTFSYKMYDYVQWQGGISKMFASTSMEALKGGDKDGSNYWAWLAIHINPKLFSQELGK